MLLLSLNAWFADINDRSNTHKINTTLIQRVINDLSITTTSCSKPSVQPVRMSSQQIILSTALFIASDWIRNSWTRNGRVKSTTIITV